MGLRLPALCELVPNAFFFFFFQPDRSIHFHSNCWPFHTCMLLHSSLPSPEMFLPSDILYLHIYRGPMMLWNVDKETQPWRALDPSPGSSQKEGSWRSSRRHGSLGFGVWEWTQGSSPAMVWFHLLRAFHRQVCTAPLFSQHLHPSRWGCAETVAQREESHSLWPSGLRALAPSALFTTTFPHPLFW